MKLILLALILSLGSFHCFSTHLRAGEITVRQDDKESRKFWITVTVYTNTINTNVLFGGDDDILDFGDGSDPDGDGLPGLIVPETENSLRPDLGYGIATASFTIDHTFLSDGFYIVSYSEPNRNEGILNMDGSVNTRFYIESGFFVSEKGGYRSPIFAIATLIRVKPGTTVNTSLAAFDDQHKLIYRLDTAMQWRGEKVLNYRQPDNFSLNPFTGVLSWDGKFEGHYVNGEFNFVVRCEQYNDGDTLVGYVHRDFQVITQENFITGVVGDTLDLDENNRIYLPEQESSSFMVVASCSTGEPIEIIAYHEFLLSEPQNDGIQFIAYDTASATSASIAAGVLTIKNTPAIARPTPYNITLRVSVKGSSYVQILQDITYLFYTQDTVLTMPKPAQPPPPVVGVEKSIDKLEAFPNPLTDRVGIEDKQNRIIKIKVLNASGRTITETQSKEVNLSGEESGLYYLQIVDRNKKQKILKVLKQ